MSDKLQKMLEPPTIEQQFQRLLDGMGLHDAKSIPVAVVLQMFKAFFNYEHQRSTHVQKMLDEYDRLYLKGFNRA